VTSQASATRGSPGSGGASPYRGHRQTCGLQSSGQSVVYPPLLRLAGSAISPQSHFFRLKKAIIPIATASIKQMAKRYPKGHSSSGMLNGLSFGSKFIP
jgi:hypothetical protein